MPRVPILLCALAALAASPAFLPASSEPGPAYFYRRLGSPRPALSRPLGGMLLAGGGTLPADALQWFCLQAAGGDLLVLRSFAPDDYTAFLRRLCPELNSVATLVVPSRAAAAHSAVIDIVSRASAIFLAGGSQSAYLSLWAGTPLDRALNQAVSGGAAIGGTSAGMEILAGFVYARSGPDLVSPTALNDPFDPQVLIEPGFLHLPLLACTLADAHTSARNRIGRDAVFLARLAAGGACPAIHGIFLDEGTALTVSPNGNALVHGAGYACFARAQARPGCCRPGHPLSLRLPLISVQAGGRFSLGSWTGSGGRRSVLVIDRGSVRLRNQ